MNKTELIKEISRLTGVSSKKTSRIIDSLLKIITECVKEGDKVSLHRFGAFHMVTYSNRLAHNISTRSVENRPTTRRLRFKPSEDFKNGVKDQGETIIPKINESIKIEYCGTVSIDRFLDIFDKYPTFKTPRLGAKILKPQQLSQKPAIGYTEPLMLEGLRKLCEHNTELRIIENVGIPISGYYRQYVPDFVLYHERANLYIDIEIDEPYVIESRKPIHYINGRDLDRDKYIINNGWVVIRYSERQVYKHLDDTIKDLDNKIKWLTYDDPHPTSLSSDKRWTEEEAKRLAEEARRKEQTELAEKQRLKEQRILEEKKRIQKARALKIMKEEERVYPQMVFNQPENETPTIFVDGNNAIILGHINKNFFRIKLSDKNPSFFIIQNDEKVRKMSIAELQQILVAINENPNHNEEHDVVLERVASDYDKFRQLKFPENKNVQKEKIAISKNILIQKY